MTLPQLYEALCRVMDQFHIVSAGSTVKWRSARADTIEAIMHELVHGVCLGDPAYSGDVEGYLPIDPAERDVQELRTLRVECRAFELLERPLSRRKALQLFEAALFDNGTPERALFEAPLTDEEQKLAREVVAVIKAA